MKKLLLVFGIAFVFGPMAMANDIAFYVGAPNVDGWYDVATMTADVETIIAETGGLFKDVQQFDDDQYDAFGAWVEANTNDGEMDILWLNGCMPSVLYPFPNLEPDGSLVEEWLDGGNMIINVGDWFGYVSYAGGSRQAENGPTGAANILDLSSGIIVSADNTSLTVTPTGKEYLPSLPDTVITYRPIALSAVVAPWEVAAVFASTDGTDSGAQTDPLVIHNTETDGYVAFVNQSAGSGPPGWLDDRGLTCAEFIGNWVNEVIGLGAQALARGPNPKDESMISQTVAMLTWRAGDFAATHDVYFGESLEQVSAATPDDADVFVGSLATAMLRVGTAGGPKPEGLVPSQTYYWRVDEINDAEPNSPWKGDVWSFTVQPLVAWNPSPSDEGLYVRPDQDLSWENGMGVLFHTVFFGETFEAVDTAVAGGWMTTDPVYNPGTLETDKTYYWRVDEFAPTGTSRGEIWSFTTVPEVAVTDADLVGWWTLDEGMGTTAVDWSGHGNHGALLGDPQWVDGYHGGALDLDGSGDYVDFGDSQDWPSGQAARSMCGWAKTDTLGAGWRWIAAYGSPGTSQAMFIGLTGASLYGGGYGDDVFIDGFWQVGVWHHICLTYDGTTARLYADGEEVVSEAKTWDLALSLAHIGRQVNTAAEFWNGMVDDVRVYSKALTPTEIAEIMRGNPLLAGDPEPDRGAIVDIRDVSSLRWVAGDTAASHDVYFGNDRAAVAAADRDAPEYQGNQTGASLSLAGLVEFGGGDYYWRIDEVEADGTTIHQGYTWKFTVPGYLLVEDFESYDDDIDGGTAIFQTWIDGWENGTGSTVGYLEAIGGTFGETSIIHGGGQSMPLDYNNVNSPYYSEAERTFATSQNWTTNGVDTLTLYVRGRADNDPAPLYVGLESGATRVNVAYGDDTVVQSTKWVEVSIPLADFAGVNAAGVQKMYIGLGDPDAPTPGGAGLIYVDDIRVTAP